MPRRQPTPPRSRKPLAAMKGSNMRPDQTNRCSDSTNGDSPTRTPWRAATKPKAQNKAEPAPHTTPNAVACFAGREGARVIQPRIIVRGGFGKNRMKIRKPASPNAKPNSVQPVDVGVVEQLKPARRHHM